MPTYQYHCSACQHEGEYLASIKTFREDAPKCPKCGQQTQYQFTGNGGGFVLKGYGWPGEIIKKQRAHQKYVKRDPKDWHKD